MVHRVLMVLMACSAAIAGAQTFMVPLSDTAGAGGSGTAFVTLDGGVIRYYIVAEGFQPSGATINAGRPGVTGGPVVTFSSPFSQLADEVFATTGEMAVGDAELARLRQDPAGFHVSLGGPGGQTVRGQLLGEQAGERAFGATLLGRNEAPGPGDDDGRGSASAVLIDDMLHYRLDVSGIGEPTGAHLHRGAAGEPGPVEIDLMPSFSNGVALGSVPVDQAIAAELRRDPSRFFFNVHTADFPDGAIRGQAVAAGSFVRVFPAVFRDTMGVGAGARTDLEIINLVDQSITVYVEWYPAGADGAAEPEAVATLELAAGERRLIEDVLGTAGLPRALGALRLVGDQPFLAAIAGSGVMGCEVGRYVNGLEPDDAMSAGAVVFREFQAGPGPGVGQGQAFGTAVGYFNPNPFPVEVTVNIVRAGGESLGAFDFTLEPFSNQAFSVADVLGPIDPAAERLTLTFAADADIFVYSSFAGAGMFAPAHEIPGHVVERRMADGMQ